MTLEVQHLLDARGLLCPMPVVRASQEIQGVGDGEVLKILATDRGALADIPAWASDTGNTLLESGEEDGSLFFLVRRGTR